MDDARPDPSSSVQVGRNLSAGDGDDACPSLPLHVERPPPAGTRRIARTDAPRPTEDDFASHFDRAGDLVVVTDDEQRIASINEAGARVLGYTPAELIGRELGDLVTPDRVEDAGPPCRWLPSRPTDTTVDAVLVAKDGRRVQAEVTATTFRAGTLIVARDVTSAPCRRGGSTAQPGAARRGEQVAHVGSWDWDIVTRHDQLVGRDVPALRRRSGRSPARLRRLHGDHPSPTTGPRFRRPCSRRSDAGGDFTTLYRLAQVEGRERVIEGTGTVTVDTDGKAVWMAGTARDVTDEHRVRAERERLEEEFLRAQKLEALALLSGEIAHDFNNALTAIRGYAALILDQLDPDSPAARDALELCRTAEHATALPRQLLAFAGGRRYGRASST